MKRAGLDYWDKVTIVRHASVQQFLEEYAGKQMFFFTGKAHSSYCERVYEGEVYLIFGRESRGIDDEVLQAHADECVRIRSGLRSLNLSNACALGVYEVLRQNNFEGLDEEGRG